MGQQNDHAVVVGASIAGLSQAAVLSRYFARVTVLESDSLRDHPEHRKGVIQDRQVHGLLARGLANLEKFLPGFRHELLASGVAESEYGKDICWFMNGTWWSRFPAGLKVVGFTRPLFEFCVRRRLLAEKNVTIKSGVTVTGYAVENQIVRGVEFLASGGDRQTLAADLVVDCTGRHSRSLRWLSQSGYGEVPTEEIEVNIFYLSQLVRFATTPSWNFVYVGTAPPLGKRMGVLLKAEGDQFLFGVAGYLGEAAPRNPEAMREFLESLPSPVLADIYAKMIPVSESATYRFKSNLRRFFTRVELPGRLLFAGDVVCSFDPVYGQGMTAATLGAEVLDRVLSRRPPLDSIGRNFHQAQEKMLAEAWMQAVANDLRYPEVKGQRSMMMRLMMSYSALVLQAMHLRWVHDRVILIFNMLKGPAFFFSPVLMFAAVLVKLGLVKANDQLPDILKTDWAREPWTRNVSRDAELGL